MKEHPGTLSRSWHAQFPNFAQESDHPDWYKNVEEPYVTMILDGRMDELARSPPDKTKFLPPSD